ncbi:MAG TPA: hypothetical protein DCL35_05360 [Candidatus Omnitrophica bacterium]|nr:hypothetical protein [Candidatus Omnitrophota bacterium]
MKYDLKKILIVHLGGMGDVLLSGPAIRALRIAYPSAEISMLVTSKVVPVVENMRLADKMFVFDMCYGGVVPLAKVFRNVKAILELRRMRFDAAINMRTLVSCAGAMKVAFLLGIIRPKIRAGRDTEKRGWFFTLKASEGDLGTKYEADLDIETVGLLGAEAADKRPFLDIPQKDTEYIDAKFMELGIAGDDLLVVIHIGGMYSRRWPIENFAGLINRLNAGFSCKVMVLAGPGEKGLLERLSRLAAGGYITPDTDLDFCQLAALIKRSGLFISNDTGPMHVAAILKTPQVAIFGPGDLTRFDPRNISERAVVAIKKSPCAPCNKEKCSDMECLKALSVEDVFGAAEGLLRSR